MPLCNDTYISILYIGCYLDLYLANAICLQDTYRQKLHELYYRQKTIYEYMNKFNNFIDPKRSTTQSYPGTLNKTILLCILSNKILPMVDCKVTSKSKNTSSPVLQTEKNKKQNKMLLLLISLNTTHNDKMKTHFF